MYRYRKLNRINISQVGIPYDRATVVTLDKSVGRVSQQETLAQSTDLLASIQECYFSKREAITVHMDRLCA